MRRTYLDHAATTPVRDEVLDAMLPYLRERFGNPSSAHAFGREARVGLERARRELAGALGCEPAQVVFTSGGTEADNLAVLGGALAARARGRRFAVAVAAVEHKAVLAAAHEVAARGGEARLLPVDAGGAVDRAALDDALAAGVPLVSCMWVNNETGVVQPVADLAARCRDAGARFHTDAVQAVGKVAWEAAPLRDALVAVSAHKVGGPKGIGALVVPARQAVAPQLFGGGQQLDLRPGTENVSGAVGLARAVALAIAEQAAFARRTAALRDELARALRQVPDVQVTAEGAPRAPHILHVTVAGAQGGSLLVDLDLQGVAASGGAACATGASVPSHVLGAMGIPGDRAAGGVRFSLGRETTAADIAHAIAAFPAAVERARALAGELGHA